MSGSTRPPAAGRHSTMRTARTARTAQSRRSYRPNEDSYSLAGPPEVPLSSGQDPHNTYFDEGYRAANPWMASQPDPNAAFSLAKTFPHKVRWNAPRRRDAEPIEEEMKGEEEPAPQVPEAQRQRQSVQQGHAGAEEAEKVDSESTLEASLPKDDYFPTQPSDRQTDHSRQSQLQGWRDSTLKPIASRVINQLDPNERPFNKWAAFRIHFQRPLAEWLGTTVFMFIGLCGNLSVITSDFQTGSMQSMYWCWGFAVMLAIYIAGGGSGAFLNPALTIMLSVFRGFPSRRVPMYIFVQLLGAFTGALLAFAVYRDDILHYDGSLNPSTTGVYLYTEPKPWVSNSTAFFTEMLGTAVIGCSILALGDSHNSPPGAGMHAFIIGLLTTTVTMALGYSTGGCFNPVRDLGPRLASIVVGYPLESFTAHQNWWIWGPCCATVTGALLGGLVYDLCVFKGGESPVNYAFNKWKVETLEKERGFCGMLGMHRQAKEIEDHAQDIAKRLEAGELG